MAPLTNTRTQLPDNIVYRSYIPKFVIGLSIVYMLSFLIRCMISKYRRTKDKRQQREIQRLKLTWKNSIKKHQFKDSLLNEHQDIECPPTTYNESFHSSSSSTLNSPTTSYKHSIVTISQSRSLSTSSSCSTASSKTLDISKQHWPSFEKSEEARKEPQQKSRTDRHWKLNNNKRLNILWQWGVSKGYVEYEHARNLNALIDELSNKKMYSSSAVAMVPSRETQEP